MRSAAKSPDGLNDAGALRQWLELRGYTVIEAGINMLVIHRGDPMLSEIAPTTQPVAQPAA